MPKIETYDQDPLLDREDRLLGTNSKGNVTQNYSIGSFLDFLIDSSTGDILVNNPDQEDITVVDGKLKFKDRDAVGAQKGYKIIRADFDWSTVPANYANSIWEIRYEFNLNGAAITLPGSVCLKFNGGKITNYTSITALNGKSTVSELEGFDGSGTIDPTWVFSEIFDTDEQLKLLGLTTSNLGYTPSAVNGIVTNSGGVNATLPLSTPTDAGLLAPINTLPNKAAPVGGDLLIIEDSENSNSKKNILLSDLPVQLGTADLGYISDPSDGTVTSSSGTSATIPAGSTVNASLMTPADKVKLDTVDANSEQNVQTDWDQTDTGADDYIKNKPKPMVFVGAVTIPFTYPATAFLNNPGNTTIVGVVHTVVGVCKVANNGHAIGARVGFATGAHNYENGAGSNQRAFSMDFDSLTLSTFRVSSDFMYGGAATAGNPIFQISPSEWNLNVSVWGVSLV